MGVQARPPFDPFNPEFHAWEQFEKIPSPYEKFKIILHTVFKTVITLGVGTKSAFRKYTAESLNSATVKAAVVANKVVGGEELTLSNQNLTQVPLGLKGNEKVEKIDFGHNQLDALPEWFTGLTLLKEINLYKNKLKSLPDDIGNLIYLTKLDVGYNELKQLPEGVCELKSLQMLVLSGNHLTQLPNNIGDLTNLIMLSLQGNSFNSFPDLSTMGKLEVLQIDTSQAKRFEKEIRKFQGKQSQCTISVQDYDSEGKPCSEGKFFQKGEPFSVEALKKQP